MQLVEQPTFFYASRGLGRPHLVISLIGRGYSQAMANIGNLERT